MRAKRPLRVLLPLAHEGLRRSDVSDEASERYLGVIEQRCVTHRTGSAWQRAVVSLLEQRGADRACALRGMLRQYVDLMHAGEPVHTWPVDDTS